MSSHFARRFARNCRIVAALIAGAGIACSRSPANNTAKPPSAEFLLSSVDSTFWISTKSGAARVRGVPLVLARYDGKFYELYASDDDFSYDDALLLGERLYRRDIANGDSVTVFADTIVPRIADAYARAHPDERPLERNEEGEANPATNATADVDVLDVFGPYVSYEYHVDVTTPRRDPWRSTRRGVIDLRSGKSVSLSDLFGESAGHRLEVDGRRKYELTRDSIIHARGSLTGEDGAAADALRHLEFDERSFTVSSVDGQPAVAFGIPGRGEGAVGRLVELDPVKVEPTPWWRDAVSGLPADGNDGSDRWKAKGYAVIARYDTSGESAKLALVDSAGRREWPLTTVLGPLRRIAWLDRPPIVDTERDALLRAFSAAASYDEAARVAAAPPRNAAGSQSLHLVSIHAFNQDRSRKPARDVRAHDAGAREQQRPRLRRRDPVDDGQDRRDRRLSAQPVERRHGVDRSRRLSPADSPRRSGRHEGKCQLCRQIVDGSWRSR